MGELESAAELGRRSVDVRLKAESSDAPAADILRVYDLSDRWPLERAPTLACSTADGGPTPTRVDGQVPKA